MVISDAQLELLIPVLDINARALPEVVPTITPQNVSPTLRELFSQTSRSLLRRGYAHCRAVHMEHVSQTKVRNVRHINHPGTNYPSCMRLKLLMLYEALLYSITLCCDIIRVSF